MVDFILYLFLNSLFIWGVHALFSEGHILEKAGDWMTEKLPSWITMPLFDCPACQSSLYGTLGYFLFVNQDVLLWPLYCLCLCGFNFIIIKLTSRKREVKLTDDEDF
jgi:hypothetical protein